MDKEPLTVRQMADAVRIRHLGEEGLRLLDAEYRGPFLYLYFIGPASGDDTPMPKYLLAQSMELDCVTEENARRSMHLLMKGAPEVLP